MIKSRELIQLIKSYESAVKPLTNFFSPDEITRMIQWSELCFSNEKDVSTRLQSKKASNNDMTGHPRGRLNLQICNFLKEKLFPIINKDNKLNIEFDVAFLSVILSVRFRDHFNSVQFYFVIIARRHWQFS